ncbi:MAG TPA: helix-turn-helix domain-containing protein [Flavilitoribacter sp.]|nr:helix-turn-helix domain-containing protein [Flavilitoribacter sp.]HMQ88913.1 helix-turn-helix domain-containing protein [Flavilitoribacter sp.]
MIPFVPIAVVITGPDKQILWVNDDFYQISGYHFEEAVSRKPGEILQGPKSEREAITRIRKALNERVSIMDVVTNYHKNGTSFPCRVIIHPIFNTRNELTNFIGFEIDNDKLQEDQDLDPILKLGERYRTSSLKKVDEIKMFTRLKTLVETEELYRDPNLTAKRVAERLGTNIKYLSQVVNNVSGQNFQRFVNTYKVAAAKKALRSDSLENLTQFGIALQCGFKNKSTFYKVFKEFTGLTPREFIQMN